MHDEPTAVVLPHAEYQRLLAAQAQLQTLLEESEARKAALARLQEQVESAAQKHRRLMADNGAYLAELQRKHNDQLSATRRACGQVVELLKVVQALKDVIMEGKVTPDSIEWPGEVFRAVQAADEVIKAYGIPF